MLQPLKRFYTVRPILETAVKQLPQYGYSTTNLSVACQQNNISPCAAAGLFPRAGHHIFEFQISEWNQKTSLIQVEEEKFKAMLPHQRLELVLLDRFKMIEEYKDILHQAWAVSFSPMNFNISITRLNQTIDVIQEASDTWNRYGPYALKATYLGTHLYLMNGSDWEDYLKRSIQCLEDNLENIESLSATADSVLGVLGMFGLYKR